MAEYIGTPPKNGFYKRQIWVRKSFIEKLPTNHSMQGQSTMPTKHFYSLEERNDPLVSESNVPQKEYYRVDHNVYRDRDNNDKIAYAHKYPNPPRRIMFMVCLMAPLVDIHLLAIFHLLQQVHLLSHLLVCGWLRRTNSSAWLCLRWIRLGHGQWLH